MSRAADKLRRIQAILNEPDDDGPGGASVPRRTPGGPGGPRPPLAGARRPSMPQGGVIPSSRQRGITQ